MTLMVLTELELARFRTKRCSRLLEGNCKFGRENCHYSHNKYWNRRCPYFLSNTEFLRYIPVLCPLIVVNGDTGAISSECNRGGDCPFAHSQEEVLYHPLFYKTKPCKHYLVGEPCQNHCPYIHHPCELRKRNEFKLPFTRGIEVPTYPGVVHVDKINRRKQDKVKNNENGPSMDSLLAHSKIEHTKVHKEDATINNTWINKRLVDRSFEKEHMENLPQHIQKLSINDPNPLTNIREMDNVGIISCALEHSHLSSLKEENTLNKRLLHSKKISVSADFIPQPKLWGGGFPKNCINQKNYFTRETLLNHESHALSSYRGIEDERNLFSQGFSISDPASKVVSCESLKNWRISDRDVNAGYKVSDHNQIFSNNIFDPMEICKRLIRGSEAHEETTQTGNSKRIEVNALGMNIEKGLGLNAKKIEGSIQNTGAQIWFPHEKSKLFAGNHAQSCDTSAETLQHADLETTNELPGKTLLPQNSEKVDSITKIYSMCANYPSIIPGSSENPMDTTNSKMVPNSSHQFLDAEPDRLQIENIKKINTWEAALSNNHSPTRYLSNISSDYAAQVKVNVLAD